MLLKPVSLGSEKPEYKSIGRACVPSFGHGGVAVPSSVDARLRRIFDEKFAWLFRIPKYARASLVAVRLVAD
jgi:hypothetical protein